MEFLLDYLPIVILSIFAGTGGYLKNANIENKKWQSIVSNAISSAILGFITLLIVEEFVDISIKAQYGVVLAVVYFSPEKIIEYSERLLRLKR